MEAKLKYGEGQWFAVPLKKGGYALGIIVRGTYKTKGGLGYFFKPKLRNLPLDKHTWEKKPEDAVLIAQFGDFGIVSGRWPLIQSTRPFYKEEWPIPKFGLEISLLPGKGFIREYEQDNSGNLVMANETVVDIQKIVNMPNDNILGGGAVEIRLAELLT